MSQEDRDRAVNWANGSRRTMGVALALVVAAVVMTTSCARPQKTQPVPEPQDTMKIGHELIGRQSVHSKPGNLVILSEPFTATGVLARWQFYNAFNALNVRDNPEGWSITPLIFRPAGRDRFEVVAIGRTRTNDSSGVQSFPFDAVEGSATVWPGFLFGWWDGGPNGIHKGIVELDLGLDDTIYYVGQGIETVELGQTFEYQEIHRTYSLEVQTTREGAVAAQADGLIVHDARVLSLPRERKVRVILTLARAADGPDEVIVSGSLNAPNAETVGAQTTAAVTEVPSSVVIDLTPASQGESWMEFSVTSKSGDELFALPALRIHMPRLVRVLPGRSFYSTEEQADVLIETEPDLAADSLSVKLTCNGEQIAAGTYKVEPRIYVPFDAAQLPQGDSSVVCEIAHGTTPVATQPIRMTRLAPKPNEVKIDYARRSLVVDGSPFFPFGFYTLFPVEDSLIEQERAYGFNVISPYQHGEYGGPWSDEKAAEVRKYMDRCAELGMKVHYQIIWHGRSGLTEADWARLKREIEMFRDHPALLCWYLADEPELGTYPPEEFVKIYRFVRELDPHHPITIVLAHPELSPFYADAMDLVMVDPYPIPYRTVTMVSDWVDSAQSTLNRTMPVWLVPQAFPIIGTSPTAQQERVMTWLGLIHGATGVQYFIWAPGEHPESPEAWDAAREMAAQCAQLSPALLSTEPRPRVTSSAPSVHAGAWRNAGTITVLAANTTDEEQAVRLELPGLDFTGVARVLFTDGEVDVQRGVIKDTLEAYGTRTYVVPAGR